MAMASNLLAMASTLAMASGLRPNINNDGLASNLIAITSTLVAHVWELSSSAALCLHLSCRLIILLRFLLCLAQRLLPRWKGVHWRQPANRRLNDP